MRLKVRTHKLDTYTCAECGYCYSATIKDESRKIAVYAHPRDWDVPRPKCSQERLNFELPFEEVEIEIDGVVPTR